MNITELKKLLEGVKRGDLDIDGALERLKSLPYEYLGFAHLDSHRHLRQGFPEVILGEGKEPSQLITIMERMIDKGENVLVTRVDEKKAAPVKERFPGANYDPVSKTVTFLTKGVEIKGKGEVLVLTAGTSDIPVAEEAVVTLNMMGNRVNKLYDVGVAGIHRLFDHKEKLLSARVIIVVAGMEGALPSVVGGMVDKPVIAVPTSVGYGANFKGITTLLAMLTSCAAGVTVVNIDNGFGAAYAASTINRL
ncbi:MAG: nickel pincer cofactor biosynthesis protein LarB [Thermodesulfobacteriota bacterium]